MPIVPLIAVAAVVAFLLFQREKTPTNLSATPVKPTTVPPARGKGSRLDATPASGRWKKGGAAPGKRPARGEPGVSVTHPLVGIARPGDKGTMIIDAAEQNSAVTSPVIGVVKQAGGDQIVIQGVTHTWYLAGLTLQAAAGSPVVPGAPIGQVKSAPGRIQGRLKVAVTNLLGQPADPFKLVG